LRLAGLEKVMRSPASAIVFKIRADNLERNCSCVYHFMKALNSRLECYLIY
jgi:hypothetical protein